MRYLGNKTKLLPAIEDLLDSHGIRPPGVFLDVFSGSAAVSRRMKALGWKVVANDHLACAATQARAAIGLSHAPRFESVLSRREVRRFLASGEGKRALASVPFPGDEPDESARPLREVLAFLNVEARPSEGLVFRQYSSGGVAGRLFFTAEVGSRIDGVRELVREWKRSGALEPGENDVLLAALLDAADRCANISGTYGAFLKTWQSNARGPLALRPPVVVPGRGSRVFQSDANALVREIECDVLYVDPPYNRRQYSKNYHVLEILAELDSVTDERAYEESIYGKTGLRPFESRQSDYCKADSRKGPSRCELAFSDLLENARARHIVISYNEEGILSRDGFRRVLERACPGFDLDRALREVPFKRFRSDQDGLARSYQVLEGRARDEVREWLIHAEKPALALTASSSAGRRTRRGPRARTSRREASARAGRRAS